MKWYKKQLDALKKKEDVVTGPDAKKQNPTSSLQKIQGKPGYRNPVAQRNRNRSKTDSK